MGVRTCLGYPRPGIAQSDALILVDVGDEGLPQVLQGAQKLRLLAVAAIDADPVKPHAQGALMTHHLQRQRRLALGLAVLGGNPRRLAAPLVTGPFLGQKQTQIRQGRQMSPAQRRKDPDLTVIDLAQPSAPLPRHAHRVGAFLGEARLVDQQPTLGAAAELSVGLHRHLIQHPSVVPSRVREHVLQPLPISILDRLLHPLHVLAICLHQAFEILTGCRHHATRSALEVSTEAAVEGHESGGDAIKPVYANISIFK